MREAKHLGRKKPKITDEQIKQMGEYLKQGKSLKCIADIMGLHFSTIHTHTKDNEVRQKRKKVTKEQIINEIKAGKNPYQISYDLGTDIVRVELLFMQNKKLSPLKFIPGNSRQEEIRQINLEIARQKAIQDKEFKKQLLIEKRELAKRFKGIVK